MLQQESAFTFRTVESSSQSRMFVSQGKSEARKCLSCLIKQALVHKRFLHSAKRQRCKSSFVIHSDFLFSLDEEFLSPCLCIIPLRVWQTSFFVHACCCCGCLLMLSSSYSHRCRWKNVFSCLFHESTSSLLKRQWRHSAIAAGSDKQTPHLHFTSLPRVAPFLIMSTQIHLTCG